MAMVVAAEVTNDNSEHLAGRSAHLRAGSFTPLFCGGLHGYEDDDDIGGGGQQALFVRLSERDCISKTVPLLATFLGGNVTAVDLDCHGLSSVTFIRASTQSGCKLAATTFNSRLGGSAFVCSGTGIYVQDSKTNRTCREKVAILNAALNPTPPPLPPPPPPPGPRSCVGRDNAHCSPGDPGTWCCNLEVYHCVCAQYGTYQEISFYCNHARNSGIDCKTCPASPRCKNNVTTSAVSDAVALP